MRMFWQGWGLALAAVLFLVASGAEFWAEWDFGNRAVAVEARVTGKDLGIAPRRRSMQNPTLYQVELAFDLGGQRHAVRARVSRSQYLAFGDGDRVDIMVDPDTPRLFEWHSTLYAFWGLIWAVVGMCLAAVAALSFATARRWKATGVESWTGVAFPMLREWRW